MVGKRLLIHTLFLLAAPVVVAYYDFSVASAVALVLLILARRWAISVAGIIKPPKVPALELETISISHFAEKARWCMDRLGVPYVEKHSAGIFGVIFTGRSVPRLKMRTGLVRSEIGNSPEILRYLWGRYGSELGEQASFLEPTAERVEMERKIDRYGVNLQVWVYYHILDHRDVALRVWGQHSHLVPVWQRALLPVLFPVFRIFLRKAFGITEAHYEKVVQHIESLLADIEECLDDGRRSILGGNDTDYVDISFAAISSLWLQPENFAAGRAAEARIDAGIYPIKMGVDIERWRDRFPLAVALVQRLYREERLPG
jgi:glutathione S-transferase